MSDSKDIAMMENLYGPMGNKALLFINKILNRNTVLIFYFRTYGLQIFFLQLFMILYIRGNQTVYRMRYLNSVNSPRTNDKASQKN